MKNLKLILVIFMAFVAFTSCNDTDTIENEVIITSVLPNSVNVGDIITVNSQNFDTSLTYTILFNGVEGTISEVTSTSFKVIVPEKSTSGDVVITYNGKTINLGNITIINIFTGDVQLLTQQEIEDFGVNNYSAIIGRLDIGDMSNPTPASIVSLEPLGALTTVSSSLRIEDNTALTNLDGLNNVIETGNLILEDNTVLTNVNGLSGLTATEGFYITRNPLLTSIEGLSSLTYVEYLYINVNESLTTLNGLQNLTTINESLEVLRTALTNIDALSNVTTLEYDLVIAYNEYLTNIEGLRNLSFVGEDINIERNPLLTNLDGLIGLTTVVGDFYIYDNNALLNADGLSNLTSAYDLDFHRNDLMSNYCGLNTLIIDNGFTGFRATENAYNPTEQDIIDGNCSN